MLRFLLFLLLTLAAVGEGAGWEARLPAWERENVAKNRSWIAARRAHGEGKAKVGVIAGVGVWYLGAHSLVECLERSGLACRVLDPTDLSALSELEAVIFPGGFAPYQWQALGFGGLQKVSQFVDNGGHCLGICAGGYLLSRTVRYAGLSYPYPTSMFDGIADGPVAGLAVYPNAGPVNLKVTEAGRKLGLGPLGEHPALYGGGPRFVGGTNTTVLLNYQDGTAACIERAVGKGRVVAVGAHIERPLVGGEEVPPPAGCEKYLRILLGL